MNTVSFEKSNKGKPNSIRSSDNIEGNNNNSNINRISIIGSTDDMSNVFTKFAFPFKLHSLLESAEESNRDDIISWLPNGKAFKIHKPKEFADVIMPQYFNQTKYRSFQRQLYIYGFDRLKDRTSDDYGAYSHNLFVRGKTDLCLDMTRQKIKGTGLSNEERRRKAALLNQASQTKQKSAKSPSFSSSSPPQQLRKLSLNEKIPSPLSSSSSKDTDLPSTSTITSSSLIMPSSIRSSLDGKKSSTNELKSQQQMPRRVSERNDDDALTLSSGGPPLQHQLEQIQLQLQLYQQQQKNLSRNLSRKVSDWNNVVLANVCDHDNHHHHHHHHQQQQYCKNRNSVNTDNNGINKYSNSNKRNFDNCYLNNDENRQRKYRRRCSLGFVRNFERRGSLLHDGDEVCFNDKKFFFTTEY